MQFVAMCWIVQPVFPIWAQSYGLSPVGFSDSAVALHLLGGPKLQSLLNPWLAPLSVWVFPLCLSQNIQIRTGNSCQLTLRPTSAAPCWNLLVCSHSLKSGPTLLAEWELLLARTATWLILPVVICLSQRLSHACLSTSLTKVKPRMAH